MGANIIAVLHHWDPYPFILLNLLFSTQAAYAAPLILLSQNRQVSFRCRGQAVRGGAARKRRWARRRARIRRDASCVSRWCSAGCERVPGRGRHRRLDNRAPAGPSGRGHRGPERRPHRTRHARGRRCRSEPWAARYDGCRRQAYGQVVALDPGGR
ncbi:DUF1003 domain-containing protein [Micromonospora reichwaldensis]|uniref:DUF1003 domain-containing protein n=1 Tax=Micromonospora reichwaldensis TaxID=3075516 RepID=UPI0037C668D8